MEEGKENKKNNITERKTLIVIVHNQCFFVYISYFLLLPSTQSLSPLGAVIGASNFL